MRVILDETPRVTICRQSGRMADWMEPDLSSTPGYWAAKDSYTNPALLNAE